MQNLVEHKPILYRSDIDGLRSLAVTMVILFHIWPHSLTGGFIGVDVFFVISGFLITSIINKELNAGTFTFKLFYTRRIKRILPVFYTMVFFTSLAAYFLLLPNFYLKFVETVVSASTYLSNVYFSKTSDYFALDSSAYPLLHTWSLSVEEQYYVFWPLVLVLLNKWSKRPKWINLFTIGLMFIASYLFSIYSTQYNSSTGYYSIFSRAFELMIGSILALFLAQKPNILSDFSVRLKWILVNLIALIGLCLIIMSSYSLNEKTAFPGYIALIPTLGAAFIIYAGSLSHHSLINRFVGSKCFVAVGLLSYFMYLWHWPLLAYWHYLNPEAKSVPLLTGLLVILMTLLLSLLSYFFIELPIKKKRYSFKSALIKFQLVPLLIILSVAWCVIKGKGLPSRLSSTAQIQNMYLSKDYCHNSIHGECVFGDVKQHPTRVILFGDSHAGSLSPFWSKIASNQGMSIKIITSDSCYPLLDSVNLLPSSEPTLFSKKICSNQIKYISEHASDYDVFILAAEWSRYESGGKMVPSKFIFDTEFKNTLAFLKLHNKKVIIMGDVPFDSSNLIDSMIRNSILPWHQKENKILNLDSGAVINDRIRTIAETYSDVDFFDMTKLASQIQSFPYENGILLYKDSDHLNQYGSELLAGYYLANKNIINLSTLVSSH